MNILQRLIGDQLKAKYSNTKLYLQHFSLLILKSFFIFLTALISLFILFFILTPSPTSITLSPVFQVKKSTQTSMITIYTNPSLKHSFCLNQSQIYFGKLYSKHQFCQLQHQNFPSSISSHNSIDVTLSGLNTNVNFITACLVKLNEDRSVCQKFTYSQEVKIFNNLNFDQLYSIQVELDLKHGNQYFGNVSMLFEQDLSWVIKMLKNHYLLISILATLIMASILTLSFALFQIPQILQKVQKAQKKAKSQ